MTVSILSAFRWKDTPRPSIFLAAGWGKASTTGKTMNTLQTEAVERKTKREGRNPGSISGLSARGDLHIEESNHKLAKKRR